MPTYVYECPICEDRTEIVCPVEERNKAPTHCGVRMDRIITAPLVQPDIQPYMAVAGDMAGKYIKSRREHKEFLKRNRFNEVGNEPIRPIKNDFRPGKGEIASELRTVIPNVLRKHRR